MKRILAVLTLASSAAFIAAAPAQAAPVNPAKALKKQYVAGHGVRVSETARMSGLGTGSQVSTTTGALEFGKSGIVATDLRYRAKGGLAGLSPTRTITVGKHSYAQGGIYSEGLPEGKTWVRYPNDMSQRSTSQPLDIFDSKVLKTLVSKAKSFKGGTYRGALTFGELGKLYGEPINKALGKVKINYALGVNSKGLITGIRSEYVIDFGVLGKSTANVSTRYTGWGAKIKVKAPPSDAVIDFTELGAETEVPQEIPNGSLNSLGTAR